VPAVIDENKKNPQTSKAFPFDDPKVTDIFTYAFPARDLKNSTETVLNATYDWLNKKTPTLRFSVDFTTNKRQYATSLADYAFTRLQGLPVCKQPPAEIDPLTATCKPTNIAFEESKKSYEEQIFISDSFLPKTVFTENDLPKNTHGQSIAQQYAFLPDVFIWLHRAPYIICAILTVLAVDFILLSSRKRRGIYSLSRILIGSGISIVIFPLFFNYIVPYFSKSFQFDFETVGTQKLFSEIFDELSRTMDLLFIAIGSSIAVLGFIIFAAERLSRPRTKYHNLEKESGLAVGIKKPAPSPKSLKNKLGSDNVPLQTSDGNTSKKVKSNGKYRTLNKKKDIF
jgi:hypothetical protein